MCTKKFTGDDVDDVAGVTADGDVSALMSTSTHDEQGAQRLSRHPDRSRGVIDESERDDDDGSPDDADDDDAEGAEGDLVDASDPHGLRWPKVLPTIWPAPPSWPTVFGRAAPLECEIGFGRPHFILERAVEVPDHDVVGIEWKGRWPRKVWEKQRKGHYKNVRALHGNAWLLFGGLFAPGSLSLIVLNFPDPWWKTKHQKRRIVSDTFAKLMASRLRVGGGC